MAELNIKLRIDGKEVEARLLEADRLLKQAKYEATGVGDTIAKWGMAVTGFNQGLDAINRVYSALSKPLDAAGQFEQFEATLKVMLGTTVKAKERMQEYVELAKLTPFELPQIVTLGNQLQAIGRYSKENIIMLGDLAAAAGKPPEQAMAAYAKLLTGQKGIAIDMFRDMLISADDWAKATGKKIGKNGELQASVEEMAAALPRILKEKGFDGMMAEQAKTYKGMASNTADALGQLTVDVGDKILPLAKQVLEILTGGINSTRENLNTILPILKIISVATASYMVAVYGLATAQNILAIATAKLKSAYETVALTIMYNPWAIAITGLVALSAAIYELNEAYGNTLENQKENNKAREEANKQVQISLDKHIKEKEGIKDLAEEYETLKQTIDSGKLSSEERQKSELRMQEILTKLRDQYPSFIKSTKDYAGSLDDVKKAANEAKGEIEKLNGELNKYQKAQVQNKIASGKTEIYEGFQNLQNLFEVMGLKNEDYGGALPFYQLEEMVNQGKLSEASAELEKTYLRYSDWATKTESDFNLKVAKAAQELKNLIDKHKEYYSLLSNGSGINEVNNEKSNTSLNSSNPNDSFEKKAREEREKILQARQLAELEKSAKNTEYRDLQEQIAAKEAELKSIDDQLLSKGLSEKGFEELKTKQETAKKSLDLLKDASKEQEKEGERQIEEWRKNRDKKIEIEDEAYKKEKENSDQRRQQSRDLARVQAENEPDEFQRRRLEAENEMKDALDDVNRDTVMTDETKAAMRIAIYQRYANKVKDIDRDLLQSQIDNAQQLVTELANGFNAIYGMVQNNANREISQWKKKESDKLEEEHKAALKRARTDRDRERIDKEYANKKDAIETEAQRKATERLKTWFEVQKAVSIAQATISTYQAAAGQLAMKPVGPWNYVLAAAMIAAGMANVAVIASQKFEAAGYDKGGRLKKGNTGFFEGNRDEIIAPEETFIEVMNRDLIPRLTRDNMTLSDLKDANSLMMLRSILSVQHSLNSIKIQTADQSINSFKQELDVLGQRIMNRPVDVYLGRKLTERIYKDGRAAAKGER